MHDGKVFYAVEQGLCVFKLVGDISYTSVAAWGVFAERVLGRDDVVDVLVDLSEARYIDSTNLGEMAKVAVIAHSRTGSKPAIVSANTEIDSVIRCMGLNVVFTLLDAAELPGAQLREVPGEVCDCSGQARRILSAHRQLCELSDRNRAIFSDVVAAFERERDGA